MPDPPEPITAYFEPDELAVIDRFIDLAHQANRPAWTRQMVVRDAVLAYVDEIRGQLPDHPGRGDG